MRKIIRFYQEDMLMCIEIGFWRIRVVKPYQVVQGRQHHKNVEYDFPISDYFKDKT